jgi:general stress protein YciG
VGDFARQQLLVYRIQEHVMANENQQGKSGTFASNPEKASEAGKKGGQHSHSGSQQQSGSGKAQQGGSDKAEESQRGGSANFANDREKASEAGKKGGKNSHGGK